LPQLAFAGAPAGTKAFALIVDDPDATRGPQTRLGALARLQSSAGHQSLAENASGAGLPGGATAGLSDFKQTVYRGACPPIGRHRYFHKLYALDVTLPAKPVTRSELEAAMKGHVLAQAELIGTYQKGDR
jgi:Raf kinase inhibitor-like YbhB/YbcL family protein